MNHTGDSGTPAVRLVLGPLPGDGKVKTSSPLLESCACYASHIDELRAVVRALWPGSIRPEPGEASQGDPPGDDTSWPCDRLLDEADVRPPSLLDSRRNVYLLMAGVLLLIFAVVALWPQSWGRLFRLPSLPDEAAARGGEGAGVDESPALQELLPQGALNTVGRRSLAPAARTVMLRRLFICLLLALLGTTALPLCAQGVLVLQQSAGVIPVRARVLPSLGVGTVRVEVEVDDGGMTPSPAVPYQRGVAVVADMPSMPKMRAERATLRPVSPAPGASGARVSRWAGPLDLTMEGAWRLRFTVGTPNGAFQMVSMVDVRGEVSAPAASSGSTSTATPARALSGTPAAVREALPGRRDAAAHACCASSPGPQASAAVTRPAASVQRSESVSVECLQRPPRVGSNRLRVVLPRGASPGLPVVVGVDMPGMPMAVPPLQAARQADGSYLAELPLSMAGLWHVSVEAGPFRGQMALTVPAPRTPSPSRALLVGLLAVAAPAGVALALRGRPVAPLASSATLLAAVLVAGMLIERRWPADTSMGMVMDMRAPDMGMGDMIAPQPVLLARVQRLPLERARTAAGWVRPGREVLVSAPSASTVVELIEPGQRVRRGAVVARLGDGEAVLAPLGGVVVESLVRRGSMVARGAPLLAVGDLRTVRIEARLTLDDLDELEAGATVQVVAGSRTGEGVLERLPGLAEGQDAVVAVTVDNVQRASRGMEMASAPRPRKRAAAAAPAEVFTAGQEVTLRYVVERIASTLVIPATALRSDEDGTWVYVAAAQAGQQVARRRAVSVGARGEAQVQVLSGLREGEPVVALCDPSLREGMVVTAGHWGEGRWRAVLIPQDPGMKMAP